MVVPVPGILFVKFETCDVLICPHMHCLAMEFRPHNVCVVALTNDELMHFSKNVMCLALLERLLMETRPSIPKRMRWLLVRQLGIGSIAFLGHSDCTGFVALRARGKN